MNLFRMVVEEMVGRHPLVQIGATIETIRPGEQCSVVCEGLIHTYPIQDVIDTMSRIFDLDIIERYKLYNIYTGIKTGEKVDANGYICRYMLNPELNSEVIIFIVGSGEHNKSVIDSYLNKYGYFCSNEKKWSDEWVRYQYEKKFDVDITDLVEEKRYIYHICPETLKEKVLKQGLVPHISKYVGFNNDYRLYFFIKDLGQDGFESKAKTFKKDKGQDTNRYIVIEVDTAKIKQDIKFYADPRMKDATYTLQGVAPEALSIKYDVEV